MDEDYEYDVLSPKTKIVHDNNCVRRIRFSTTMETTAEDNDSIKVYARLKPPINDEDNFLENDNMTINYKELDKHGGLKTMKFTFHQVFSTRTSQKQLFLSTLDKEVHQFVKGEDRLIFAYGTTGSGKTHTILGTVNKPGLLARCGMKLFIELNGMAVDSLYCPDQGVDIKKVTNEQYQMMLDIKDYIVTYDQETTAKSGSDSFNCTKDDFMKMVDLLLEETDGESVNLANDVSYSIWISYLEIYNENIYDLLDITNGRTPLKIGYDSKKNNYVKGLTHINAKEWIELWKIFLYGRMQLHTNETVLNKSSSRSHSVFTIKLLKLFNNKVTSSSLTICDLAGCERLKKTNNEGSKLKESQNINFSLMMLNRCFATVRENKLKDTKKIAPYRDSKLTRIFQKAFTYGEPMTMIVNISGSNVLAEETKNVLKMSSVAQEMVKPLPKLQQRFLKPHSRFSIMCANRNEPINNRKDLGVSGIIALPSSCNTSSIHREEIREAYEAENKKLKDDIQKYIDKIAELSQTLEDARCEYLHLEDKYKDLQDCMASEEEVIEELKEQYSELDILYSQTRSELKRKCREHLEIKRDLEEDLNNKNLVIAELKETIEKLKFSNTVAKPSGRALLSKMDHLLAPSPSPEPIRNFTSEHSFVDSSNYLTCPKTPESYSKSQSTSVRKSARKVTKPRNYCE